MRAELEKLCCCSKGVSQKGGENVALEAARVRSEGCGHMLNRRADSPPQTRRRPSTPLTLQRCPLSSALSLLVRLPQVMGSQRMCVLSDPVCRCGWPTVAKERCLAMCARCIVALPEAAPSYDTRCPPSFRFR